MVKESKLKKVTFALPEGLLSKLRTLADNKCVTSVNAVVREAVEAYVAKLEREDFLRAMTEAANDPEFMRDVQETEAAFRFADDESAKVIPKW